MKKKGFLLIETIISIFFIEIILFMLFKVFFNELNIYKIERENIRNNISMQEALNFIEYKIANNKDIEVINNQIIITDNLSDNLKIINRKIVRLSSTSLQIRYEYKNKDAKKWMHDSTNVIIKPIKQFEVKKEENIIYVKIVDNEERMCKRLFYIKN